MLDVKSAPITRPNQLAPTRKSPHVSCAYPFSNLEPSYFYPDSGIHHTPSNTSPPALSNQTWPAAPLTICHLSRPDGNITPAKLAKVDGEHERARNSHLERAVSGRAESMEGCATAVGAVKADHDVGRLEMTRGRKMKRTGSRHRTPRPASPNSPPRCIRMRESTNGSMKLTHMGFTED